MEERLPQYKPISVCNWKNDNTLRYPLVTRDPIGKLSQYIDNEKILMALIDISAPMSIDEILKL